MATSFELFDQFREYMPEEVAREMAQRLAAIDLLATKADVAELRTEFAELRSDLKGELARMEASIYRWMLTFNATLFLGIGGMIVAIVLRGG